MSNKSGAFIGFFFLLIFYSCKEKFEPNLPALKEKFLVVEGFINANGPTQIKLSRTVPLQQVVATSPELNAKLSIEVDDNSASFVMSNNGNGIYSSPTLPISSSKKYRLRIKTANNQEYVSKFVEVKITPPIDSVNFKQDGKDIMIYANTHDTQNKSIYYRWNYDETWEINSVYTARFIYENGQVRERKTSDPQTYYCWKYNTSNDIILGSSAKLTEDKIFLQPLRMIKRDEERFGVRYSILVRQYTLGKEEYEFYDQMKKNTELLGTIFDPQPSALRGNIQCISNPDEIAIGYIGINTVTEKRIFISPNQLTGAGFNFSGYCISEKVMNHPDSIKAVMPFIYLPYDAERFFGAIVSYNVSSSNCIDCRLRNGTNVKPSYW